MNSLKKRKMRIEFASLIVLVITVVLFAMALVEKGLTHDILLEAGVFLVSAKLILSSQKSNITEQALQEKLDRILAAVEKNPKEFSATPHFASRMIPTEGNSEEIHSAH